MRSRITHLLWIVLGWGIGELIFANIFDVPYDFKAVASAFFGGLGVLLMLSKESRAKNEDWKERYYDLSDKMQEMGGMYHCPIGMNVFEWMRRIRPTQSDTVWIEIMARETVERLMRGRGEANG